jgi:hypothetical protein
MTKDSECWKGQFRGRCCCNCKWHLKDFSHPETDGIMLSHQRGWVCYAPEFEGVFSGWGEHGHCEMYALQEEKP